MVRIITTAALAALTLAAAAATAAPAPAKRGGPVIRDIHAFQVKRIDGKAVSLSAYQGKTLLVVNTASRCGFTKQYASLEKLYQRYRDRGFEVLAFPANDFMGQEPGTDAEIQSFCSTHYDVTFPLFSKIVVKGKGQAPLYAWLTKDSGFPGDIEWNFAKFLVGPDGRVIARFSPKTDPLAPDVVTKVEDALALRR
jgi:glutathione peroxidase